MTVAVVLTAIALYVAAAYYVQKSAQYLEAAEAPWDRLYASAKKALADQDMPEGAANFATAAVMCAGCGCMTRQILLDVLFGGKRRRLKRDRRARPKLNDAQKAIMSDVAVHAIYYDSLRTPFSGFILRRVVMPWLRAASEGTAHPKSKGVRQIADSSRTAISHRKEGRKLLKEVCA